MDWTQDLRESTERSSSKCAGNGRSISRRMLRSGGFRGCRRKTPSWKTKSTKPASWTPSRTRPKSSSSSSTSGSSTKALAKFPQAKSSSSTPALSEVPKSLPSAPTRGCRLCTPTRVWSMQSLWQGEGGRSGATRQKWQQSRRRKSLRCAATLRACTTHQQSSSRRSESFQLLRKVPWRTTTVNHASSRSSGLGRRDAELVRPSN